MKEKEQPDFEDEEQMQWIKEWSQKKKLKQNKLKEKLKKLKNI